MTQALLREQIDYYRRRAAEYDATAYGDLEAARRRIDRIIAALPPAESTLELACGTGMWTQALARRASTLVAADASPEALEIARARCPADVEFVCADVLTWQPARRFDLIFFGFWLSHVPSSLIGDFFAHLERSLGPGGSVVFVDEPIAQAGKEVVSDDDPEVAHRTLADGSQHRLVKNYVEPRRLSAELGALGWALEFAADGTDWIVGTARRNSAFS